MVSRRADRQIKKETTESGSWARGPRGSPRAFVRPRATKADRARASRKPMPRTRSTAALLSRSSFDARDLPRSQLLEAYPFDVHLSSGHVRRRSHRVSRSPHQRARRRVHRCFGLRTIATLARPRFLLDTRDPSVCMILEEFFARCLQSHRIPRKHDPRKTVPASVESK